MNYLYRLLLGIFASLALSACVFAVDHDEIPDPDAGHHDVFADADGDADTGGTDPDTGDEDPDSGDTDTGDTDTGDADPDPSIELSLTVTRQDQQDPPVEHDDLIKLTNPEEVLSLDFDCTTVPEEADCTIECAFTTGDDEPPEEIWTEDCDTTLPLLFEQDLNTHYRAHQTDDETVSTGPHHTHTTRVRFDFDLAADTLPPEEIYYADQGQISPHCTSPILQGEDDDETFDYDCEFESCTWESEADGDTTTHCDGDDFHFNPAGESESDTLTVVVCSTDFDDNCETIEITYTLVQPEWTTVSAGHTHTCGILADHSLWCWGNASNGRLGLGDTGSLETDVPNRVPGTWSSVSAGDAHTCAIDVDGALYCWGQNNRRQSIPTDTSPRNVPTPADSDYTWVLVSAGGEHSCALTTNEELFCWGDSASGQLGPDPVTDALTEIDHPDADGTTWTYVSAGHQHNCAIDSDENAWCWGNDGNGRLGHTSGSSVSKILGDFTDPSRSVLAISAGREHSCSVADNDQTYCWGSNSSDQLGHESMSTTIPQALSDFFPFITAGGQHSCGIDDSGDGFCWGDNARGQLGRGDTSPNSTLESIDSNRELQTIFAGHEHTCAISEGDLLCWGRNNNAQLGIPDVDPVLTPTAVDLVP